MNTWVLMAGGAILALGLGYLIYNLLKDNSESNFRRAKSYHMQAEKYYSSGKSEEANDHYELARYHRERAEIQLKGEN